MFCKAYTSKKDSISHKINTEKATAKCIYLFISFPQAFIKI